MHSYRSEGPATRVDLLPVVRFLRVSFADPFKASLDGSRSLGLGTTDRRGNAGVDRTKTTTIATAPGMASEECVLTTRPPFSEGPTEPAEPSRAEFRTPKLQKGSGQICIGWRDGRNYTAGNSFPRFENESNLLDTPRLAGVHSVVYREPCEGMRFGRSRQHAKRRCTR